MQSLLRLPLVLSLLESIHRYIGSRLVLELDLGVSSVLQSSLQCAVILINVGIVSLDVWPMQLFSDETLRFTVFC